MTRQIRLLFSIGVVLAALPGCLTSWHRLPEPSCEVCDQFQAIPDECRAGVYVFLVNGNDPFHCANLKGVRQFLSQLGFVKTYYGEVDHEDWLAEELVCINRDHPGSRFVVVGFEYGADSAHRIALAGTNHGATVDMLLFLEPKGSNYLQSAGDPGIRRIVSVHNDKWLTKTAPVEGSEIIGVSTPNRYGVPTHPEVIELLTSELTHLAPLVPIVEYLPEPIPALLDETAPPPRPLKEPKAQSNDEWDFLKLISKRPVKRNRDFTAAISEPPLIVEPHENITFEPK